MRQALVQAQRAFDVDEVPVGAVVVMHGKIIAKAYNQVQLLKDVTAHAEILAITSACEQLQEKYLTEATLYVTLEPCLMCAGALYWNKIGHIVFGATDEKNSYRRVSEKNPFHPSTTITGGILAAECAALMTDFFKAKR
ncbi:MAG: nucleoside deaminase [Sediminibacterium sp.]|nr:nucleoside deaminase [Sediminibacterium sp.]